MNSFMLQIRATWIKIVRLIRLEKRLVLEDRMLCKSNNEEVRSQDFCSIQILGFS